jgi:hypothetical protein
MSSFSDSYKNSRVFGTKDCPEYPFSIPEQAENLRNRISNSKPILVEISNLVCEKMKVKSLTNEEIAYLVRTVRGMDYMKMVHLGNIKDVLNYISDILAEDFSNYKCASGPSYDAKQMYDLYNMKSEQYNDIKQTVKSDGIKPTGIEKEYYQKQILEFNSRFKTKNTSATTEFVFTVASTGAQELGLVRSLDEITNVRSMRIFPFSIPYNVQADSYFGRIGLHIKELSQGVKTYNSKDFHFLFNTTVVGNRIELEPIIDTYNFPRVIYQLTDITFVFRNQNNEVLFDAGEIEQATFTDLGGGVFQVVSPTPHNLSTGDLVNFEGFKFAGESTAQTDQLNSEQGHFITVVNSTTFTVNVDMSTSLPPDPNWLIVYTSKQFIIDIEFEYIRGKQEGHLVHATHDHQE